MPKFNQIYDTTVDAATVNSPKLRGELRAVDGRIIDANEHAGKIRVYVSDGVATVDADGRADIQPLADAALKATIDSAIAAHDPNEYKLTYDGVPIRANGTDVANVDITGAPGMVVNLTVAGVSDTVTLDAGGGGVLPISAAVAGKIVVQATDMEYNGSYVIVEAV